MKKTVITKEMKQKAAEAIIAQRANGRGTSDSVNYKMFKRWLKQNGLEVDFNSDILETEEFKAWCEVFDKIVDEE